MASSKLPADGIVALLAATFLTGFGLKTFEAWPQVLDLWQAEVHPILLIGHPHLFRYLVAYPGFMLEAYLPSLGFSLYVGLFFAANVALWRKLSLLVCQRKPTVWAWAIFLAAHLAMNGRGVIAWTAWLLCACTCLEMSRGEIQAGRKLVAMAGASLLAAVSTGVFMVTVSALTYFHWKASRTRPKKMSRLKRYTLYLVATPIVFVLANYFATALTKNLDFYGGGLTGALTMLEHGLGVFLLGRSTSILLVLTALSPLLAVAVLLMISGRPMRPAQTLLAFAIGGGLFGFTVLTLAIPIALLLFQRKKHVPTFHRTQKIHASHSDG